MISVLFDDGLDAIAQAPDLAARAKSRSVWEYGATRGVDRLCETFAAFAVRTSWFVPATVALKHAALVRGIASAGHDLEGRGWSFERYDRLPRAEALDLLIRSRAVLDGCGAAATSGFRLPIGRWPRGFDALLVEAGYRWSASLNGDDIPYDHAAPLVEIPVHVELEDRPYFQFNFTPPFPKGLSRLPPYEAVLNNWIAEFDAYRRHGLCYVLQVRPEMIGTPGRIFILEGLLRHILHHPDVWITTGSDIADWHASRPRPGPDPVHPLAVFSAYLDERHRHDR